MNDIHNKLQSIKQSFLAMSPEEQAHWREEEKKCLESPLYFYNNYWRKKDQPELTQQEFDIQIHLNYRKQKAEESKERFGGIREYLDFNLLPEFLKKP